MIERDTSRDSIRANIDRPLVIMYLLLLFAGWANIYSAAYTPEHPNLFDMAKEYGNQSVWIMICLIMGAALMMVNGQFLKDMALPVFIGVMFLLALVPLIGKEVGGNKAWLGVGSFGVQPSEFGKFATALLLSKYLSGLKSLGTVRQMAPPGFTPFSFSTIPPAPSPSSGRNCAAMAARRISLESATCALASDGPAISAVTIASTRILSYMMSLL